MSCLARKWSSICSLQPTRRDLHTMNFPSILSQSRACGIATVLVFLTVCVSESGACDADGSSCNSTAASEHMIGSAHLALVQLQADIRKSPSTGSHDVVAGALDADDTIGHTDDHVSLRQDFARSKGTQKVMSASAALQVLENARHHATSKLDGGEAGDNRKHYGRIVRMATAVQTSSFMKEAFEAAFTEVKKRKRERNMQKK
eukprot:TRINITY_DN58324_c0_g1_i1.p1 TRINITY_DN58324_c0_g1~~TRINITY_DN58324_c0_g1_i1.p1  ORF type:complete len:203 (-),score=25.79 TRINITY_DN58324_c0_g1_i1:81-689(-)